PRRWNHRRTARGDRLATRTAALGRAPPQRLLRPMANGSSHSAVGALPLAAALTRIGEIAELSFAACRQGIRTRRDAALVFEQLDQVGVRSLSIVNLTALFMGMV